MSWWQRFRTMLRGSVDEQASAATGPLLLTPSEDDPLLIVHRYSQKLGHLSERPKVVDAEVLVALSKLLETGRAETAIRLGQSLSRAVPTDFALARLVAETLCRAKRYAEALGPLELALTLSPLPESLRLRFLLAEAHLELGETEKSRRRLSEIVALDLNYPEARARLESLSESRRILGRGVDRAGPSEQIQRAIFPTVALANAGRYELLAELGAGRMGTVYRAFDRELHCELALKVFHPHLRQQGEDDALLRALHEARLLSAARHPGIVALYAVEGDDLGEQKQPPLLVMELCQGGSLRSRLRAGVIPIEVALRRTGELLGTLAELHAGSVSHGDLKPENLLFRGDGRCRFELPESEQPLGDLVIADFGLSRLRDGLGGAGVGTLGYLSQERFLGGPPSPPADVFAVGVVLIEMLCGENVLTSLSRTEAPLPSYLLSAAQSVLGSLGAKQPPLMSLLGELLSVEASNRPTAETAAERLMQILQS